MSGCFTGRTFWYGACRISQPRSLFQFIWEDPMFCPQFDRGVVVLSLTVAVAGIAGCAHEGTTPTAPTTASAPAPTTSVPLAGATISGTVVGVASAASV